MRLKNVLITVKDIEQSKKFYHDLFGLDMILDNDGNMILTEGLVLQDAAIWQTFLGKEIIPKNHSCELYFEERDRAGYRGLCAEAGISIPFRPVCKPSYDPQLGPKSRPLL